MSPDPVSRSGRAGRHQIRVILGSAIRRTEPIVIREELSALLESYEVIV